MSAQAKRGVFTVVALVAVCAAIGLYIGLYLINVPGSVAATQTATGDHLYLATVPAAEVSDPHNTWVSYYAVNATSTVWRHDTTFEVPANTLVHVTIYQYDTSTGLRNPFFSQPSGTVGSVLIDGKPTSVVNPMAPAHTFAIPQIGLSIPLPGANSNAKNLCSNAPCSLSNAHVTVSFTFRTPVKGLYRWQCFVPCAAGFIQGNGGPMQTVGYMGGFLKVV
ncbi:MAG TPA: hypothetical protein VEF89_18060 [Solirubrobacteraceae bacterium]|nr:hypothetical protein [Solirubrobacteraceae bacterium]